MRAIPARSGCCELAAEPVVLRLEQPGRRGACATARRPGLTFAVPQWYHAVMAMNLRLDEEDSELLRAALRESGLV